MQGKGMGEAKPTCLL